MKIRRVAAMLLAASMAAGLLAGCGSSGSGSAETAEAPAAEAATEEPAADAPAAEAKEVTLPLCEEKETITIWMRNDVSTMNISGGDPNNTAFYKELEERTNVHVEWMIPASGSEQEQFNLLFASGELPDMMYNQGYIDGLDAAIDDEYLLDLTPYVNEYMPNYLAAIEKAPNPNLKKYVRTDSGRYGAVYTVFETDQIPWMGWAIRQDWLDELGLEVPVTYEDYENVLKAFKEKKGCSAPLAIPSNEILAVGYGYGLYGGGLFVDGWYQENGETKFYFYSDREAGRKTLETLTRWYSEGLIDPDFATGFSFGTDSVIVNNGNTGLASIIYTHPNSSLKPAVDAGAKFTPLLPPVEKAGDPIKARMESQIYGASMVISADSEKKELCMRWLDYLFSEEGALFANYGIEGETFEMVDGEPSTFYDWTREFASVPQELIDMCYVWNEATTDNLYLYATMSAEENQEYTNIFTDLNT